MVAVMRLLNTSSLLLQEFYDDRIPRYAILSHRWTEDEPTLQDWNNSRSLDTPGRSKIGKICALAHAVRHQWIWIDTICIDKKSSAELSESINSMFNWYRNATVCYAYLADVPALKQGRQVVLSAFRHSEWFNRRWTLQELIAPATVIFTTRAWEILGIKQRLNTGLGNDDQILSHEEVMLELSQITGVPGDVLRNQANLRHKGVAQPMSWAARRRTTRKEDGAYCLMGLFNIHMPLLYGEGQKAFQRLQLEIIASSDDESIFVWTSGRSSIWTPLLCESPNGFSGSGNLKCHRRFARRPYLRTNQGLECRDLTAYAAPYSVHGFRVHRKTDASTDACVEVENRLLVPLNCGPEQDLEKCSYLTLGRMPCGHWARQPDINELTPVSVPTLVAKEGAKFNLIAHITMWPACLSDRSLTL